MNFFSVFISTYFLLKTCNKSKFTRNQGEHRQNYETASETSDGKLIVERYQNVGSDWEFIRPCVTSCSEISNKTCIEVSSQNASLRRNFLYFFSSQRFNLTSECAMTFD
ncbi:unnamed protein product [Caenorhabditis brenneri]